MILYHGSYTEVESPNVEFSRRKVDFGAGFYTTPILEQAKNWSGRFLRRQETAYVSYYDFDEKLFENFNVRSFDSYSEEWLDFILTCRTGLDNSEYDIVIGGVANDKVFNTVELYFDNLIDKGQALERLLYEEPNVQICFRNQDIINKYLRFVKSEKLC